MSDTPRALIVYESMFGNTWKVAAAIRDITKVRRLPGSAARSAAKLLRPRWPRPSRRRARVSSVDTIAKLIRRAAR